MADNDTSNAVAAWLREISRAQKREKNFRKTGRDLALMYEAGKQDSEAYNILYSNTETLSPALYNTPPRPVVQRRFKDEDRLGADAAKVVTRILEYSIDNGSQEDTQFDDLLQSVVIETLVPGRGLSRFSYEATFAEAPGAEVEQSVTSERVSMEAWPWDRFLHGYARKWEKVPWIVYEHDMTEEELKRNFPETYELVKLSDAADADDDEASDRNSETSGKPKLARVFELWDKETRSVYFLSESCTDCYLKEPVSDPLGLPGFFNCPKPLTVASSISGLTPIALYSFYKSQAAELNKISVRINKIVGMMKVRGMYDSTVEGLEKVFVSDDGTLIPVENVAGLIAQNLSLEKAIWLVPIERYVAVLQQLYIQREQIKTVIFEITGLADIMRGSSVASETLGAQQLKNQWGTLRLKRMQKLVANYAKDCLRIIAEISLAKLSQDTIRSMTGLQYATAAEKAQMQMAVQEAQVSGRQIPPQLQQQVQEQAAAPTWEDILGLLKSDLQRNFRIDIETNSTVDTEATEDKQNIAELLNALSQFLNGVSPLVENGSMPFEAAQGMLLAIVRRFRFGPDLEDQLKKMKQPPPKDDPKAKSDQKRMEFELQKMQMELQAKQQEMLLAEREAQMNMQLKEREFALKMQELSRKAEFAAQQHALKLQQMAAQAAAARSKPAHVTAR